MTFPMISCQVILIPLAVSLGEMNTLPDSSLVWTCASVYTSAGSREWSTKSHGSLSILSPSISDTQASKESYTSNPNVALYGFCCCSSDLHPKEPHLPKSKISLPKSIHIISGKTGSVYLQKAKRRVGRRRRRKRRKKETRPIQTWYKASYLEWCTGPEGTGLIPSTSCSYSFSQLLSPKHASTFFKPFLLHYLGQTWKQKIPYPAKNKARVIWITQNFGSILGSSNS